MYTEQELKHILGEPTARGPFLGKASGGEFVQTPWGAMPRVQSGVGEFMSWTCAALENDTNQAEALCFALRPEWGPYANQGWFVVQTCTCHANLLRVTPFKELVPRTESFAAHEEATPKLEIVDSSGYRERKGADWDKITLLIDGGWVITLVQNDHRFPSHTFIVMEKP